MIVQLVLYAALELGFDNAKTVSRVLQYLDSRDRGQVYVGCPRSYFGSQDDSEFVGIDATKER